MSARLTGVACGLGIVASAAFAVLAVRGRDPVTIATDERQFVINDKKRVIDRWIVQRAPVAWEGGRARVEWYDSNLEPLSPRSHAVVSLYIDGSRKASVVKGAGSGVIEDANA